MKKDHTPGFVTCCVVFLFAPLEDVTEKLSLFSIIPKSNPLKPEVLFFRIRYCAYSSPMSQFSSRPGRIRVRNTKN